MEILFIAARVSGPLSEGGDLVELAVVDQCGGQRFHSLAQPKVRLSSEAIERLGVNDGDLMGEPSSNAVRAKLYKLCERARVGVFDTETLVPYFAHLTLCSSVFSMRHAVRNDLELCGEPFELPSVAPRYQVSIRAIEDSPTLVSEARLLALIYAQMQNKPDMSMRVNGRLLDLYRGNVFKRFRDVPDGLYTYSRLLKMGYRPGGVPFATIKTEATRSVPAGTYKLFSLREAVSL